MRRLGGQVASEERHYEPDLTLLAYLLVAVFTAFAVFSRAVNYYTSRYISRPPSDAFARALTASQLVYPGMGLFILLEMLIVLWVWVATRHSGLRRAGLTPMRLLFDVGIGIFAGLAGLVIAFPFFSTLRMGLVAAAVFPSGSSNVARRMLGLILFGLSLPAATEMVFRGIAQKVLAAHMSAFSAVLVSAVLFGDLLGFLGLPFYLVVGLVSACVYWRRGAVLPCIAANATMTVVAGWYL